MTIFRNLALVSATILMLTGCISRVADETLEYAPPQPEETATIDDLAPYKIQVADVLEIKFPLSTELNETVTVRPDGLISTALATDVEAYGKTPKEVKLALQNVYAKILQNPEVGVIVKSFAPTRFYVAGEVERPGEFINVGPNLTFMQAISRAGGLRNTANIDEIVILRRGSGTGGEVFKANFLSASSGADPTADVRLAPYDVVFVPRSTIGNVGLHYDQYIKQFITPNFTLGYQFNPEDNN
jgi:polysaccharide biosynthesis/export protein